MAYLGRRMKSWHVALGVLVLAAALTLFVALVVAPPYW
jgi:hypothetical protein